MKEHKTMLQSVLVQKQEQGGNIMIKLKLSSKYGRFSTRRFYKIFWYVNGELSFRWKWLRDLYFRKWL